MVKGEIGELSERILILWTVSNLGFFSWVFGIMRNSGDGQGQSKTQGKGVVSRSARSSLRAISSYLRIVSSGASTVARSAVSAASSIVDREDDSGYDQVRKKRSFTFYCDFAFFLIFLRNLPTHLELL